MTPLADQARVTVAVRVPVDEAFRAFVEDIDLWWRRGLKYRVGAKHGGVVHLEPKVGGRLYESFDTPRGHKIVQTGTVTCCEPPKLLVFEWRAVNFRGSEKTLVEVQFQPAPNGTQITLTHSGWEHIRPDHPARHGQASAAFLRSLGLWWGEQLTSLRVLVQR